MVNVLMELLSTENHSSVRVMVEWLVIRVLLHKPSLFHKVLKAIQKSDEKRMAYLCSLFTIATHLVMSTTADKQVTFLHSLYVILKSPMVQSLQGGTENCGVAGSKLCKLHHLVVDLVLYQRLVIMCPCSMETKRTPASEKVQEQGFYILDLTRSSRQSLG